MRIPNRCALKMRVSVLVLSHLLQNRRLGPKLESKDAHPTNQVFSKTFRSKFSLTSGA